MSQNLLPTFERSWLEVELIPSKKERVTAINVDTFQKELAKQCGMHIFCGPLIISPDSTNQLSGYYTNKKFMPQDWNAFTWWTRPDVSNIVSILDHSHEVLYYYPKYNLIDISIATCKSYDLQHILSFIQTFWHPNANGLRYIFVSPKTEMSSWKNFVHQSDQ